MSINSGIIPLTNAYMLTEYKRNLSIKQWANLRKFTLILGSVTVGGEAFSLNAFALLSLKSLLTKGIRICLEAFCSLLV